MAKKNIAPVQDLLPKLTGYKATDANMICKGHQFALGEWYEIPGDKPLELCKLGFHFCEQPSGVYEYYTALGTRVFICEAEQVLVSAAEPGAGYKRVARRIRLVSEVTSGLRPGEVQNDSNTGYRNTGDRNTGYRNTGDSNTGDRNTGYSNTGYSNTGDRNTGYRNTGYSNTGYSNTGDRNTGYRNTGDRNTGYRNTGYSNTGDSNAGDSNTGYSNTGYSNTGDSNAGDRNTGDRNTGYRNTGYSNTGYSNTGDRNTGYRNTGYSNTGDSNTGDSNATDRCAGFFCVEPQLMRSFDVETTLTFDGYTVTHSLCWELGRLLQLDEPISFSQFKTIPGITPEKLLTLHEKHKAGRKK